MGFISQHTQTQVRLSQVKQQSQFETQSSRLGLSRRGLQLHEVVHELVSLVAGTQMSSQERQQARCH